MADQHPASLECELLNIMPQRPFDAVRFEKGKIIYTWKGETTTASFPDGSTVKMIGDLELTMNDPTVMGEGETPQSVITIIPEKT